MKRVKIPAWHKTLKPYDDVLVDAMFAAERMVMKETIAGLHVLAAAAKEPTETNCGAGTYNAALVVRHYAQLELNRRAKRTRGKQ